MKKLFLLFALIAMPLFAQQISSTQIISDTLSNSITKTGYIGVPGNATKACFVIHAKGEIDIDQMIVTEGWLSESGAKAWKPAEAGDTTTVTIDLADGAYSAQSSTQRTDLSGTNIFKVTVTGASSGNDATDPNSVKVYAVFYK